MNELQEVESKAKVKLGYTRLGVILCFLLKFLIYLYNNFDLVCSKIPESMGLYELCVINLENMLEAVGIKYVFIFDLLYSAILLCYCFVQLVVNRKRNKELPSKVLKKQFIHTLICIVLVGFLNYLAWK